MRCMIGVVLVVATAGCSKSASSGDASTVCDAIALTGANATQLRKTALDQYESAIHASALYYQWEHLDYDGKHTITPEQDSGMKYTGGWIRARGYAHTAQGLCDGSYDLHDQLRDLTRSLQLDVISDDATSKDCPMVLQLDDKEFDKRVEAWKARAQSALTTENAYADACYQKTGGKPDVVHPLRLSIAGE